MKSMKKNWWKVMLIVAICVGIHTILLPLVLSIFPSNTEYLKPSILVRKGLEIPSVLIFTFLDYIIAAVIFVFIQDKLPNRKWLKGLLYGFSLGSIYFVGMFEGTLLWDDSILKSTIMGLIDSGTTILMGTLLGIYTGTDGSASKKKQSFLSIFVIAIVFLIGRYFSYYILHISSSCNNKPLGTLIWTFCQGLSFGIVFFNLQSGIKGNSQVSKTIFLGLVIIGLNWLMYHFFIAVVAEASFTDIFTRVGMDCLFTILGVMLWEKLFKRIQA